ncbi:MAG: EAL domain-containing protein [Usitatibacter sp.]
MRIGLVALVLLAFGAPGVHAAAAAFAPPGSLVVVSDDNYPPYLFRAPDGRLQGILKDKWELWSQRTGVPVEVRGTKWAEAQRSVRSDAADVIDALVLTPARTHDYSFSRSEAAMEARVFFHRDISGIRDAASLRGLHVGAKAGSACADWLREQGVESIGEYPDSEAVVAAAARREIEIFCMDSLAAHYFLYKLALTDQYRESVPLYSGAFHWAVREGRAPLRDFIETGFQAITDRELREIDTRWMGEPVQFPLDPAQRLGAALLATLVFGAAASLIVWNCALRRRLLARAKLFDTRDFLTDLPNRALLHERLTRRLARAHGKDWIVAVLFIDLDRFKALNDAFGRALGDRVLKEAAGRLLGCVGEKDVVGRVSSDEFAVVLSRITSREDAAAVARRILAELHRPYDLDARLVYCTASIGIAVHPRDGTDAGSLIRNADIAMYRAKESGRNTMRHYEPEMHAVATRRLQMEMVLRGALGRGEFALHYQPRIDARTRAVTGFEALLRWNHPEHGLLAPAEFVPILEETGLIVEVGEWVLDTVCRQVRAWQERGLAARPVAVNLSARQFLLGDLDAVVAAALARAGISAAFLELELTESLLMRDPEQTVRTLRSLERRGVRIAVDDFGTGYSSLAYLSRFPIDSLKIDRAFIRDAEANPEDRAIISTIIQLAHGIGLTVIAEGVETEAQLDLLRAQGCDEVQGFLFSKPVTAMETAQFL